MKNISLNIDKALGTVSKEQVYAQEAKAMECIATLHWQSFHLPYPLPFYQYHLMQILHY